MIFELGAEDDALANETIDKISFYLALALSHIGNMLNPEKIIIGGGVSAAGDQLLTPVKLILKRWFSQLLKNPLNYLLRQKGMMQG